VRLSVPVIYFGYRAWFHSDLASDNTLSINNDDTAPKKKKARSLSPPHPPSNKNIIKTILILSKKMMIIPDLVEASNASSE
jgi:hypothetical protein